MLAWASYPGLIKTTLSHLSADAPSARSAAPGSQCSTWWQNLPRSSYLKSVLIYTEATVINSPSDTLQIFQYLKVIYRSIDCSVSSPTKQKQNKKNRQRALDVRERKEEKKNSARMTAHRTDGSSGTNHPLSRERETRDQVGRMAGR